MYEVSVVLVADMPTNNVNINPASQSIATKTSYIPLATRQISPSPKGKGSNIRVRASVAATLPIHILESPISWPVSWKQLLIP